MRHTHAVAVQDTSEIFWLDASLFGFILASYYCFRVIIETSNVYKLYQYIMTINRPAQ